MTISHIPPDPRTLTWTGVRTIRICPQAFFRRYVANDPEIASAVLERGSGVHEILETLGRADFEGVTLDPAQVTALVESHAALLEPEAADDLRAIVKTVIARGLLPQFPSDAQDVGFEQPFAIDADGNPVEWDSPDALFRSIFDQAYRENGGTLAVIRDHKTSRVIEPPAEQLRLYAFGAFALWPDVEGVVGELHYVRYGAVRRATYDRESVAGVLDELRALRLDVESRLADDRWEPRLSDACLTCGYRASCPAMVGDVPPMPEATIENGPALAARLVQLGIQYDQTASALKALTKEHGPIDLGNEVIGYVATVKESIEDVGGAAALLTERGVTTEKLYQELSLPKASLSKLVTAAIASVPKKEKGAARAAFLDELRAERLLVATTTTTFKRSKKGAIEGEEDAPAGAGEALYA